jgi:hypothetical protein
LLENKHLIVVGLVIFLISIFLNLFFYLKKPIFKEVVGDTNTIMVTVVPFFENCNDNFTYSSPPPKLIISALSNEEINIPGKGFKHFYDHFTLEIYGNSYFIKFDKQINQQDLITYLKAIKNKYFYPKNLSPDSSTCEIFHEFFITEISISNHY